MNLNQPSSTITTVGVMTAVMAALWAIYGWLDMGPPATEIVVTAINGAVVTIAGYLKRENVYTMTAKP